MRYLEADKKQMENQLTIGGPQHGGDEEERYEGNNGSNKSNRNLFPSKIGKRL